MLDPLIKYNHFLASVPAFSLTSPAYGVEIHGLAFIARIMMRSGFIYPFSIWIVEAVDWYLLWFSFLVCRISYSINLVSLIGNKAFRSLCPSRKCHRHKLKYHCYDKYHRKWSFFPHNLPSLLFSRLFTRAAMRRRLMLWSMSLWEIGARFRRGR